MARRCYRSKFWRGVRKRTGLAGFSKIITSRRSTSTFLARMEKSGGPHKSGALVQNRLPPTIQKEQAQKHTPTNRVCFQTSSHLLPFQPRETASPGRHGNKTPGKTSDRGSATRRIRALQPGLPQTKTHRGLETNHRSQTIKRKARSSTFQNGHMQPHSPSGRKRHVGHVDRLIRRVSTHTDKAVPQEVSVLPGGITKTSVSSTAVRPFSSPLGVLKSYENTEIVGQENANAFISVSRRLVQHRLQSPKTCTTNYTACTKVRATGPTGQFRKVGIDSQTNYNISRGQVRLHQRPHSSHRGEIAKDTTAHPKNHTHSNGQAKRCRISAGPTGGDGKNSAVRPVTFPPLPAHSEKGSSRRATRPGHSISLTSRPGQPTVVESSREHHSRLHIHSTTPNLADANRCIHRGLGVSLSRPASSRQVDSPGKQAAHQCLGDASCGAGHTPTAPQTRRQISVGTNRQHYNSDLPKETRRYKITKNDEGNRGSIRPFTSTPNNSVTSSHTRPTERPGRPGVQSRTSDCQRMVAGEAGFPMDIVSIDPGPATSRPVCHQAKHTITQVHLPMPRRRCPGDGRIQLSMAEPNSVCLSPAINHNQANRQVSQRTPLPNTTRGTGSTRSNVVPNPPEMVKVPPIADTAQCGGPLSTSLETHTPQPHAIQTTSLADNKAWWLNHKGFSNKAIARIQDIHAKATKTVYGSQWKVFERWCLLHQLNPVAANGPILADFMIYLFEERNLAVRSIEGYRSALAATLKNASGYDPGQDECLSTLIKNFKQKRPPAPRHVVKWDLGLVLRYLRSSVFTDSTQTTLQLLTFKTTFLLALASGKRRGEIHALEQNYKSKNDSSTIILKPRADFLGKTHIITKGKGTFSEIELPHLTDNAEGQGHPLCPVATLLQYIERTKAIRHTNQKRLIISFLPHVQKDISKTTISNYIRQAVVKAYEFASTEFPEDEFTLPHMHAHEVRQVACSIKAATGATMDEILKAGTWSNPNAFITRYLQDYTVDSITKLCSLPFVAAESIIN